MPRGRKRPPQDSVDSILLAISRRDNIDPDTLSHYFERLDEEWTEGARSKVLHLLRTRDTAAHAAAVLILSELATDFDLEELEDLVADPTVSDMAKLTIAPVLKELDSEMADDGLIEYLNDPEAAMQQMQARLLELVGQSELGVESVLEDILSMPLERRLGFVNWLGSSHDPRAAQLLIPLLENQSSKVVTAAIDALEQLGPIAVQQSIPALNYMVAHSSNRQMKELARAALGRLTMYSVPGVASATSQEDQSNHQLQFYEARVSFIDGVGSQMIMLAWKKPDNMLKGINILYQDQWGIKDCYGTDDMDINHWTELVSNMYDKGFGSFQVPLEYGRALIAEAYTISKRSRRKLPLAYTIWRPFIESDEPSSKKASISTRLEPVELTPETLELALRGDELFRMQEFMSWMLEPPGRIQYYIDRYWSKRDFFKMAGPGSRSRNRKASQKKHSAQDDLETLISEAIHEVINDTWRAIYETRLLRQAALFQFARRTEDVQLVRATAAALHPASSLPAEQQPFLRTMMRITIEQGPLRALAEALEAARLGSMPTDLFPDKD